MKELRLLAGVVLAGQLYCMDVRANPVGPVVQAGGVTFRGGAGSLQINQSTPRAIVNWQGFSIGRGETTRINQPSAQAALLNRVTSANPSQIYGNLQANGRVYLINPNGVLVGRDGKITAGQFVGSTRDVADREFMRGGERLRFSGNSDATIRNEGVIQSKDGGVYLAARTVENAGTLSAPRGTVGLAAGSEVVLQEARRPGISVVAGRGPGRTGTGSGTGIDNSGVIEGVRAELKAAGNSIYSLAIANRGVVRATSVTRENGSIVLRAAGGRVENSGVLRARNADGSGGSVQIAAGHEAANNAVAVNSGTVDARGETTGRRGGAVQITGDRVALEASARVDVSGSAGGGTALIGGDAHGQNSAVQNARQTEVSQGATIRADAVDRGNGGKVVVWSDGSTRFAGSISAKGGTAGGDGGFVETSGKAELSFAGGEVRAGARSGRPGTWLVDPEDITIDEARAQMINDSLDAGTSVTVQTRADLNGAGDITVATEIRQTQPSPGAELILDADRDIKIDKPITIVAGSLSLLAVGNIIQDSTAKLEINGNTILSAGLRRDMTRDPMAGDITLDRAANSFGNITVSLGRNVSLRNDSTEATDLVGAWNVQKLTLTVNGAISQSGQGVTVAGATTINANGEDRNITLENENNDFGGTITVNNGGDVRLVDKNSLSVGGSSGRLDAEAKAGNLTLAGYTTSGALKAKASGDIQQTAAVTVGTTTTLEAGKNITLNKDGNDFIGVVTVAQGGVMQLVDKNAVAQEGVVQIVDKNRLTVGGSSGSLDAEAKGGDLTLAGYTTTSGALKAKASGAIDQTEAEAVVVKATTTLDAGGDITLCNVNNDFMGAVTVVKGSVVKFVDINAFLLGNANVNTLEVTANGNVTQTEDSAITAKGKVVARSTGGRVEWVNPGNTSENVAGSDAIGNPAGLSLGQSIFSNGESSSIGTILGQITALVAAPLPDPGRTVTPDVVPEITPGSYSGVYTPGLQIYGEDMGKEADKKAKGVRKVRF